MGWNPPGPSQRHYRGPRHLKERSGFFGANRALSWFDARHGRATWRQIRPRRAIQLGLHRFHGRAYGPLGIQ
jgi:hypothetical protein